MQKTSARTRLSIKSVTVYAIAIIGLFVLLPWQVSEWIQQFVLNEIASRSRHTLNLVVENLNGELAKYSLQPLFLANNPHYKAVLQHQTDNKQINAANLDLERINAISGASDTYLMDANGLTIAASNWASEKTFIGQNFSFRPYFKTAMQGRLGRYFALGTTSGERGYYFAYPVHDQQSIIGVVVVKMRVDQLETAWQAEDHEIIVTDTNGIIFLSSNPSWRFRTIQPLTEEQRAELRESLQYAGKQIEPLHISTDDLNEDTNILLQVSEIPRTGSTGSPKMTQYLVRKAEMGNARWQVMILARTENIRWQVNLAMLVTVLFAVILLLSGANIHQRRKRITDRIAIHEAAQADLERRVAERTEELEQTNTRLTDEIQDRLRTEEELRQAQSNLVQATKLSALGQMAAGLSHELNQPLAAIGTYANNARAFIERGDTKTTLQNLLSISDLIRRMARIIENLRTYARNEPIVVRQVPLAEAIEGALDLLNPRITSERIAIDYAPVDRDLFVHGGEVRLQQVFVNLISNSFDAMKSSKVKKLRIVVLPSDGKVRVSVSDTGPGIAADVLGSVFDPFFSTKDTGQGTGLGLSIAYGIVKQFGGSIDASNQEGDGAVFTVTLIEADKTGNKAA